MAVPVPIYKNVDMRLRFRKVKDVDKVAINNGTCVYFLTKKSDGTQLATGNVPHIVDSVGDYWATIDKVVTTNIVEDEQYLIKVTFSDPDGNEDERYMDCYGALRR